MSEFVTLRQQYIDNNDLKIRNEIALKFSYITEKVARHFLSLANASMSVEDMINQGMLILLDSIDRFDPLRNDNFEAYAYMRIRGGIIDTIRKNDFLPKRVRTIEKEIRSIRSDLTAELGHEPTSKEIADKIGINEEDFNKDLVAISNASFVSFDEYVYQLSASDGSLQEHISTEYLPEEMFDKKELKKVLAQAISKLTDKEKAVITFHYYEDLNFTEIAKIMDVSPQRVSQINIRAVQRMRDYIEECNLI
ncbi:MAG: FliA/WhiG family RNA polymerase sigma factor [Ruminococcus sp.]|nr:FliA/WhiG family RNA polymerase sigma factor [Ruminococcus sp.]